MKKQLALACLLAAAPVFAGDSNECQPPADYNLSAYVFNARFSCKKEENKEIHCGVWGQNIFQEKSGKTLPCGKYQQIQVTDLVASDYKPNNPIQDAISMANKERAKYRKQGHIVEVYKCSNQNFAMSVRFAPTFADFVVYLYHEDSDTFLAVDSKLPYDLPANSPLIAQTTQALKTYLCYSFDPKKFLDTLQAPAFAFPDLRSQQEKQSETEPADPRAVTAVAAPKEFKSPLAPKALPQASQPAPPAEPAVQPVAAQQPKAKAKANAPTPAPKTPVAAEEPLPQEAAFSLANVVFYPVASPVKSVRHFQSADKQVDLKINFKAGDKNDFLQKLRQSFPSAATSRETLCPQGLILFEAVQAGSYRAFLLHPSALVAWDEPIYLDALSNAPFAQQKRQELCTLNPLQFQPK